LIVYRILVLTKKSGAVQILSGLGILAILYFVSHWLQLVSFHWLLDQFFSHLFIITVILFQGEIRQALAQIGKNPFLSNSASAEKGHVVDELARGSIQLGQKGYGALIVIENEIVLDYFVEKGTVLDSQVSADLLNSIFHPQSPLHDGAVIIKGTRIFAAACFLPLSKNPVLDKNLGSRHRAALGLTEETDAFVIVISEENRSVSLVHNGQLLPDMDLKGLRKKLYSVYSVAAQVPSKKVGYEV